MGFCTVVGFESVLSRHSYALRLAFQAGFDITFFSYIILRYFEMLTRQNLELYISHLLLKINLVLL